MHRFEMWRGHVLRAVELKQQLQVVYFDGMVGCGRIESFAGCREDAIKRDSFWPRRKRFLEGLPPSEHKRLDSLDSECRDDSLGERPGSERGDEEELLFMASLPAEDRAFLEAHKGLGNSQKAEVAWLEMMGLAYSEVGVESFMGGVIECVVKYPPCLLGHTESEPAPLRLHL
jgi:hypothetical protein